MPFLSSSSSFSFFLHFLSLFFLPYPLPLSFPPPPSHPRSGINSRGDTHRATVPLVERKEVKEKKKKKEGEDADMMEEGEIEREEGEEMEEELMAHFHGHFLEVVGHIRNISSLSKPSSFSSFSSSLSIVLASLEANHSPPSSPLPSKGEEERKWEQGKRESGMIPFSSPSISLDIYCQRYFRDLETMSSQIGQVRKKKIKERERETTKSTFQNLISFPLSPFPPFPLSPFPPFLPPSPSPSPPSPFPVPLPSSLPFSASSYFGTSFVYFFGTIIIFFAEIVGS